MAWSKKQKAIASSACRKAGIGDHHRRLVLRQLPNALYDAKGRSTDEPTSTSKHLTNRDFDIYMAIIEREAGGRVLDYGDCHWQKKAEDHLHRMRQKARTLATLLADAGVFDDADKALANWIRKRVTKGETDDLDRLDYTQLRTLLTQLDHYTKHNAVGTG